MATGCRWTEQEKHKRVKRLSEGAVGVNQAEGNRGLTVEMKRRQRRGKRVNTVGDREEELMELGNGVDVAGKEAALLVGRVVTL